MAKFAPVVPVHMAASLQSGDKDYLGEYHLLLAHDVIDKPDAYREVYGTVRRRYGQHSFIIMDNSIVELGEAMQIDDLLRACEIVRPDCLVVPDVMGDAEATQAKAVEFHQKYIQVAHKLDQRGENAPPLLGVVQGETVEKCVETFSIYYTLPMVEYLSVPRIVTKQQGSRMPALMALAAWRGVLKHFRGVHLLGFSDNILDDVACARLPFIQGIDSAVPIRAGLQGLGLNLNDLEWSSKVGPRGNFWERECDSEWAFTLPTIQGNLDNYRAWIKSTYFQELPIAA